MTACKYNAEDCAIIIWNRKYRAKLMENYNSSRRVAVGGWGDNAVAIVLVEQLDFLYFDLL